MKVSRCFWVTCPSPLRVNRKPNKIKTLKKASKSEEQLLNGLFFDRDVYVIYSFEISVHTCRKARCSVPYKELFFIKLRNPDKRLSTSFVTTIKSATAVRPLTCWITSQLTFHSRSNMFMGTWIGEFRLHIGTQRWDSKNVLPSKKFYSYPESVTDN